MPANDVPIVPGELPFLIWQEVLETGETESLIACFQHHATAYRFMGQYAPISGHVLRLEHRK